VYTLYSFSLLLFTDAATTQNYTLSLHDALPIWHRDIARGGDRAGGNGLWSRERCHRLSDGRRQSAPRRSARARSHERSARRRGEIGRAHVELQSPCNLVCRLLLEKKQIIYYRSQ